MGLFKNGVGRPSNETLRKRRIIATVMIFAVVLVIGACVFYTVSYYQSKNADSIGGSSKNAKTYQQTGSSIAKNFRIENATGISYKSSDKTLKIEFKYFNNSVAIVTIVTDYDKNVTQGVKRGLFRYYYKSQVKLYDANGMLIKTLAGGNIKKANRRESFGITTDVARIDYNILDATKGADKDRTVISTISTKVEPILNYLEVTFPDTKLAKCVLSNYNSQNKTSLTDLTNAQLLNLTKLDCTGKGITNVKGVEKLTNLKHLIMPNNNIYTSSFDLTKNTKLTKIDLSNNNISKVVLTKNKSLITLYLSNNPIEKLDVSKNVNLTYLKMNGTKIKEIKVNNNTLLNTLDITNCPNFKSSYVLDLRKNTKLDSLYVKGTNIEKVNIRVASNLTINKVLKG